MNRATVDEINNDHQITSLRMEMEDLINGKESMSEDDFNTEGKRIQNAISQRFDELYAEYK